MDDDPGVEERRVSAVACSDELLICLALTLETDHQCTLVRRGAGQPSETERESASSLMHKCNKKIPCKLGAGHNWTGITEIFIIVNVYESTARLKPTYLRICTGSLPSACGSTSAK